MLHSKSRSSQEKGVQQVIGRRETDAWQILDALVQPFRTIVLIGLCFGLRISEILRLRWTDFDFKRSVVLIQRSAVGKRLSKLKTEYSQDEVPIERDFILELRKRQSLCVKTGGRWLFPTPVTGRPYHADSIRADYLVPTGLQLGLGRIGFHTFRHTYRAWLDETGAPVGVQQKSAALDSINKGNCETVPLIGQFWTLPTTAQLPVTL
jgi:integrase